MKPQSKKEYVGYGYEKEYNNSSAYVIHIHKKDISSMVTNDFGQIMLSIGQKKQTHNFTPVAIYKQFKEDGYTLANISVKKDKLLEIAEKNNGKINLSVIPYKEEKKGIVKSDFYVIETPGNNQQTKDHFNFVGNGWINILREMFLNTDLDKGKVFVGRLAVDQVKEMTFGNLKLDKEKLLIAIENKEEAFLHIANSKEDNIKVAYLSNQHLDDKSEGTIHLTKKALENINYFDREGNINLLVTDNNVLSNKHPNDELTKDNFASAPRVGKIIEENQQHKKEDIGKINLEIH